MQPWLSDYRAVVFVPHLTSRCGPYYWQVFQCLIASGLYSRTVCSLGVLPLGTFATETCGMALAGGPDQHLEASNASCPTADSFPSQPPSSLHSLGNHRKPSLHRSRQPPSWQPWLVIPPPPQPWCLIGWHAVSLASLAFPLPSQIEAALTSCGHQHLATRLMATHLPLNPHWHVADHGP